MKLTEEQFKKFRQPFERMGAFSGRSEEEIKQLVEDMADIYVTLAESNLRNKQVSKQ